jgi:sodium/bile acid cotransporter 7
MLRLLKRARPDPFLVGIVSAAALGMLVPCSGTAAVAVRVFTKLAIAAMFFMQGVKLSRSAVLAGIGHWRLHLAILACSFVVYPVLGWSLSRTAGPLLPSALWTGFVFLCLLPSTVQSSIAYVSLARGNVAASVCAATGSNLVGIVATPALAALVLQAHGYEIRLDDAWKIASQILLPFGLGQLAQRWLAAWAKRHKALVTVSDRGSIVLVVYSAFSAATLQGVWRQVAPSDLGWLVMLEAVLLVLMFMATCLGAPALRFSVEDEIAIVFCGTKKSLASGAPIASVLFPAATLGAVIVPLVIFHQMQLIAAAVLARRYATRSTPVERTVRDLVA